MKNYLFQLAVLVACFSGSQNIAFSSVDADITAGKRIYIQCTGCHTLTYHRTGPKHCGLLGRHAGSATGYEFTKAMKDSGIIWTKKTLDQFLKAPLAMIPGTNMGYSGIPSSIDRAQLITFLSTLTENNPLCR
jgi:cytochrome c